MSIFKLQLNDIVKSIFFKLKKLDFTRSFLIYVFIVKKFNWKYKDIKKTFIFLIKNLGAFYTPSLKISKGKQFKDLFGKVSINIPEKGFIVSIDEFKSMNYEYPIINNISVDYSKILNNSLKDMDLRYNDDSYSKNQKELLDAINIMIYKEVKALKASNRQDKEKYIRFLENIKDSKANSFEEALQRILFFNQLLWQTGHKLNGFGRLDKVLHEIYLKDSITKDEALDLLKEFLISAHKYYYYKSNFLIGDTGQIIVLGGLEEDNTYFYNDLTYLFIKAVKELNLPDPKLILRVSQNTPRDLMGNALECIATGVGSPLISNDDVVIPKLIDFSYTKEDSYNYVVSACWEPAPLGKCLELNNVGCILFLEPLNNLLDSEDLSKFKDFDSFLNKFKEYLTKYVENMLSKMDILNLEEDPLISLFIEGCDSKLKDVSKGGAVYNNYGLTSVSLSNTINSLYNIKNLVFDKKEFSLDELNSFRKDNFPEEDILLKLTNQDIKFGMDNEDIIDLTNTITNTVNTVFKDNKNKYGGKFKFGLSAPSYISKAPEIKASLDGRRNFEPFNVHISLDDNKDYTELMRFASKLEYDESRFNGNVVDIMVSPDFINNNFNKFLDFLILSLKLGIFQMQLNVVSSDMLIKAKENPSAYPNLIVRVWGFSTYFTDLPAEYQDVLIKRALENESGDLNG